MRLALLLLLLLVLPFSAASAHAADGTLELHAHFFMKEGMGWFFSGGFNEPLHAASPADDRASQINPAALAQSEIALAVPTLYANALFTRSLRDSVRAQLDEADTFVRTHPDWIIARDPAEARLALSRGQHVLVLALEGASGILENDADIAEFVTRRGIRIVTLLHLMDDEFGGVAFLSSYRVLSDFWVYLSQFLFPGRDAEGNRTNLNGITARGREMTRKLIDAGVWVDLAHASDASVRDLEPILTENHRPLLYTHTALRRYMRAERAISDAELARVARSRGIIGLMPSPEYLEGTPYEGGEGCEHEIRQLAVQYREAAQVLGPENVALGSDFNGAISHLSRDCMLPEGLTQIGDSPAVWTELERLGAPVPKPHIKMVEAFVDAWERARRP